MRLNRHAKQKNLSYSDYFKIQEDFKKILPQFFSRRLELNSRRSQEEFKKVATLPVHLLLKNFLGHRIHSFEPGFSTLLCTSQSSLLLFIFVC